MPDIPDEFVGHLTTVLARDHKCDRYGNARGCRACERRARLVAEAVLPDMWDKIREEYMWKEATALKQLERVRALCDDATIATGPGGRLLKMVSVHDLRAALEGRDDA